MEGEECPICLGANCDCSLACGHRFHAACIRAWACEKGLCPVCTRVIVGCPRQCGRELLLHPDGDHELEIAFVRGEARVVKAINCRGVYPGDALFSRRHPGSPLSAPFVLSPAQVGDHIASQFSKGAVAFLGVRPRHFALVRRGECKFGTRAGEVVITRPPARREQLLGRCVMALNHHLIESEAHLVAALKGIRKRASLLLLLQGSSPEDGIEVARDA